MWNVNCKECCIDYYYIFCSHINTNKNMKITYYEILTSALYYPAGGIFLLLLQAFTVRKLQLPLLLCPSYVLEFLLLLLPMYIRSLALQMSRKWVWKYSTKNNKAWIVKQWSQKWNKHQNAQLIAKTDIKQNRNTEVNGNRKHTEEYLNDVMNSTYISGIIGLMHYSTHTLFTSGSGSFLRLGGVVLSRAIFSVATETQFAS